MPLFKSTQISQVKYVLPYRSLYYLFELLFQKHAFGFSEILLRSSYRWPLSILSLSW